MVQAAVDATPRTLDAVRLEAYLRHRLPDAERVEVSRVTRILGGLSRETWSFDAAWDDDGRRVERGLILRRDPDAGLLSTSRDDEFGVLRALAGTAVPVPDVYWLEPTCDWLDRPFFVMERVSGETSPALLLTHPRYQEAKPVVAQRKVEVLAALHELDWESLGLDVLSAPGIDDCAVTEIDRWEQVLDQQELEPQPVLRGALEWMRQHLPPPPHRISVVHGDYRTGNFLYDTTGEISAVLDWELAHLGDPMEDVGYVSTCRFTPEGRLGAEGLVGGLLERDEFLDLYARAAGAPVDRDAVRFWEVLANVKIAAIALTGVRSFCDGRTGDLQMALLRSAADQLGRTAIDLIDGTRS